MKKTTFFAIVALVVSQAVAQVHVINDAFIYSKGTDIFITQELELRTAPVVDPVTPANDRPGSAFYLRDEAHLLQGDDTDNSGDGFLSVFQEGVADNFTYNYWSSPVSFANGTNGNSGFRNTQIYFPNLMMGYPSIGNTETDLVIKATQATILPTNFKNGTTDTYVGTPGSYSLGPDGNPLVDEPLRIASRWLYSYNSIGVGAGNGGTSGYEGWQAFSNPSSIVLPGYGFTMKGVSGTGPNIINSDLGLGQRYDFRGIPNNGDIQVGVEAGDFSLVGNPYPSSLDLKRFIVDSGNSGNITPEIYFWDSQPTSHLLIEYEGGYGTYIPGDPNDLTIDGSYVEAAFTTYNENGIPTGTSVTRNPGLAPPVGAGSTRRYVPVGQGFMIQRNDYGSVTFTPGSDGLVTFKNSHRVPVKENSSNSLFKAAPIDSRDQNANSDNVFVEPKLYINAFVNGRYNRTLLVVFGENATFNYDFGMEGTNNANKLETDVYMPIPDAPQEYIIQTVPYSNETAIPLSFKSTTQKSTFEIQVRELINLDADQILLYDKQEDVYHDILNDFVVVETGAGKVENRYEIVFEEKSTLNNASVTSPKDFTVFQNDEQSLLTIQNPNGKNITAIQVYDLAGRLVASLAPENIENAYTFNTSTYATGVYVVKVSSTAGTSQAVKVVVSN